MAVKLLKHKWHKVTVVIASIIIALILVLGLVVNAYWSPVLENKVKDIVAKSSDGLYKVDFSSADLHVLRGTIVIFNISLVPDTAVYNAKKKQHLAPNNLLELHIKKLVLSNIHPFRLYFQHKLDIGQIMLYNPELNVGYELNHKKDTILKDRRTAWQKISKSLHYIHVRKILMGDVKLKYTNYEGDKPAVTEFKELNVSATDLMIDSATQTDKSRLLYCKDITAELNNFNSKTPNGLYTWAVKSVKLSTEKSTLTVTGLTLKPAATDVFFSKSHKDRFTVRLDSARLNNFDYLNYHKYRTLTASSLIFGDGTLEVFANPNHSNQQEDKIKSFPGVALNKLPVDIRLDTVRFKRIHVIYDEFNLKSKKTGTLHFNNTSGSILNVTNNAEALKKNNIVAMQLSSYFMYRGLLKAQFNFNLTDPNSAFTYKGSLGPMDLVSLNPACMPLSMVKVNEGTLKEFTFDIKANRRMAKGRVELLYNYAKVVMLKADTAQDKLKKKLVATLFANIFILKHNNPDNPGEQPRVAYVTYIRKPEKAFFGYMWQTLLSGIKPSVGLDKKTEQSIAIMQTQSEIKKQQRALKKEQRKQRRAERKLKREEKKNEQSE